MPNLNRVFLIGNVTRDIEMRYTPKGTAVCELSLAVHRIWKDGSGQKQEEVVWVDVTFWGRTAEVAQQYLRKGSPAFIEGRLTLDTWDDKQTGQKRSKLKVIGEHLQLLGSKPEGDTAPGSPSRTQPAARPGSASRDLDAEPDDIDF